jgi:hypothetical protein
MRQLLVRMQALRTVRMYGMNTAERHVSGGEVNEIR